MSSLFNSAVADQTFIVDNSADDRKVAHHVRDWCAAGVNLDIGTGTFEIGGLLALGDHWPKTAAIRILMGDEISLRTKSAFERAMARLLGNLNQSLEEEKKQNDFLAGVDAIVQALAAGKIACRVYTRDKFHAKAYIARTADKAVAMAGSSNLTAPGLTENVELNTRHTGAEAAALGAWFDLHWGQAQDVTDEIVRTIERHVRLYSPFEIYAKSLDELFLDATPGEQKWEATQSRMFKVLAETITAIHARGRTRQIELLTSQLELERQVAVLAEDAFGLTPEERELLHDTKPVRDPKDVLSSKLGGEGLMAI